MLQVADHWIVGSPVSTPMSVYSGYKGNRKMWGIDALGSVVVEVELQVRRRRCCVWFVPAVSRFTVWCGPQNGMVGVGISIGGEPACHIVEQHLARFVEGQDIVNVELIWDQMYRATLNYGRKGLTIQAISAVDLAIWDALGKVRGEP